MSTSKNDFFLGLLGGSIVAGFLFLMFLNARKNRPAPVASTRPRAAETPVTANQIGALVQGTQTSEALMRSHLAISSKLLSKFDDFLGKLPDESFSLQSRPDRQHEYR